MSQLRNAAVAEAGGAESFLQNSVLGTDARQQLTADPLAGHSFILAQKSASSMARQQGCAGRALWLQHTHKEMVEMGPQQASMC